MGGGGACCPVQGLAAPWQCLPETSTHRSKFSSFSPKKQHKHHHVQSVLVTPPASPGPPGTANTLI